MVASAAFARLRPSTRSAHGHHPFRRGRRAFAGLALAVHAADESDVFVAGHLLRPLDGGVGNAEPVGHDQHQRTLAADLLIPHQRAFGCHIAALIIDPLHSHDNPPSVLCE
jgi:hypothetical protein